MCHIRNLSEDQQRLLESLPARYQRDFTDRTDHIPTGDAEGTYRAFLAVLESLPGKSGELIEEIARVTHQPLPVRLDPVAKQRRVAKLSLTTV